ncbi:hypothetical protein GCM10009664_19820 [Kitasatospora gansuensis]
MVRGGPDSRPWGNHQRCEPGRGCADHSEDIISTRIRALSGALLLGALGLPALGTAPALAAPTDLYVDNAATAGCSDAGSGTRATPYCTVSAAAAAVEPGQTVHIGPGDYPGQVTLTRSGTAQAPITFAGTTAPFRPDGPSEASVYGGAGEHGLVLSGVQYVRVSGLKIGGEQGAVLVDGGSDLAVTGSSLSGGRWQGEQPSAVTVTGGATRVTVARNWTSDLSPFIRLSPGVRDTVIATNSVWGAHWPAIVADGATGTAIVGNTVSAHCQDAVVLTGASTGSTVANNVLSTDETDNHLNPICDQAATRTTLRVGQTAAQGTKVSYNVLDSRDGSPAYQWAGTAYDSVSAFAAANAGQGDHDVIGVTDLASDSGELNSPVTDSADETARGATALDLSGRPAVDDPWAPDEGTGSRRRDRGARELTDFGTKYQPVGPVRVLDTRTGTGAAAGAVAPGGTLVLPVTGANDVPADRVTAVTMNVTVTEPTSGGHLTVYPNGDALPATSSLNWTAGQTVPNLVTVKVKDGKVAFHNGGSGTVQVVADLLGYYSTTGSGFTPVAPARLLDTRGGAPMTDGSTREVAIAGVNGIPSYGLSAVTLNITVTEPTSGGYLTAYPHGQARPTASNLNWVTGQTVPNLVTVPVKDGKVSLFVAGRSAHVIADVTGYYTVTGKGMYHALTPGRLLDTRYAWFRSGPGDWEPAAPVAGRTALRTQTVGYIDATAVSLNVTVTNGRAGGFLTVHPYGTEPPTASNLNWTTGQTVANHVVAGVSDTENSFFNGSSAPVDLIVDLNGYFAPPAH